MQKQIRFWGKHNTLHNALGVSLIIKVPGRTAGGTTEALVENVDIFPTLCALAGLAVPPSVQGRSFGALLDRPEGTFRDVVYARWKTADTVVTQDHVHSHFDNAEQMLYDRSNDPQENLNVAGDPAYTDTLARLNTQLDAGMHRARRSTLSEQGQ